MGVVQAIQAMVEGGVWSDLERGGRAVELGWWRGLASPVAAGKSRGSFEQCGSSISPWAARVSKNFFLKKKSYWSRLYRKF